MDQCQVTVGDHVVIAGGQYVRPVGSQMRGSGEGEDSDYEEVTSKKIFILDLAAGNWSYSGVELPVPRMLHSCGVVYDNEGNPTSVVVAGGDDGNHGVLQVYQTSLSDIPGRL